MIVSVRFTLATCYVVATATPGGLGLSGPETSGGGGWTLAERTFNEDNDDLLEALPLAVQAELAERAQRGPSSANLSPARPRSRSRCSL